MSYNAPRINPNLFSEAKRKQFAELEKQKNKELEYASLQSSVQVKSIGRKRCLDNECVLFIFWFNSLLGGFNKHVERIILFI
jgi:hypothetical protein